MGVVLNNNLTNKEMQVSNRDAKKIKKKMYTTLAIKARDMDVKLK